MVEPVDIKKKDEMDISLDKLCKASEMKGYIDGLIKARKLITQELLDLERD